MSVIDTTADRLGALWLPLTGPLVWTAHFFALYLTEAGFCSGSTADAPQVFFIAMVATGAAVVLLLTLIALQAMPRARAQPATSAGAGFLRAISVPLAALALIGVLWQGLPVVLVRACAPAVGA